MCTGSCTFFSTAGLSSIGTRLLCLARNSPSIVKSSRHPKYTRHCLGTSFIDVGHPFRMTSLSFCDRDLTGCFPYFFQEGIHHCDVLLLIYFCQCMTSLGVPSQFEHIEIQHPSERAMHKQPAVPLVSVLLPNRLAKHRTGL